MTKRRHNISIAAFLINISLSINYSFAQEDVTCSHLKTTKIILENPKVMSNNQRDFDVIFYDINLTVSPRLKTITGSVGVLFQSKVDRLDFIELDLYDGLSVFQVTEGEEDLVFDHSSQNILKIYLSQTLDNIQSAEVVIQYSGTPGSGSFGFNTHAGESMIWTLSEPYGARNWWPCKDTPNDKADSVNISITVPSDLIVASNGLLVDETESSGWKTYHWEERYPIATYLVSLAIYPYQKFYDWFVYGENDSMRLDYYVYPDHYNMVYDNYMMTKNMISDFSDRFGLYPFIEEKYGHAEFESGGGIEHQTLSSMKGYSQHLISHELGHQWWGNMVTCANFHHIWLNEGFATYSQAMWYETRDNSIEVLHNEMSTKEYWGSGTIYVEDTINVGDIFNVNLSYNKASWVLHMLRHIVGDSLFFGGLREYGDQYRYSSAVTENFCDVMEEFTGKNLHAFFDRWIYGEYYPQYHSYPYFVDVGNETSIVTVIISQEQSSPLFEMPVDVEISTTTGTYTFVADVTQQDQEFIFTVDGTPSSVLLDPDRWILRKAFNEWLIPYMLHQNFPNPFNLITTLRYDLPEQASVTLIIYDMLGREITQLVNTTQEAGFKSVQWDAKDSMGRPVSAGVYLYQIQAGEFVQTKKMVLLE